MHWPVDDIQKTEVGKPDGENSERHHESGVGYERFFTAGNYFADVHAEYSRDNCVEVSQRR